MQYINSLIENLGVNYYKNFIIEPDNISVDYDKNYIMVIYEDKPFYELNFEDIKIKKNEILINCKSLYKKALAEILVELSKKNDNEALQAIDFLIGSLQIVSNVLKKDCYIDHKSSRYYTTIYDNFDDPILENLYEKKSLEVNTNSNTFINPNPAYTSLDVSTEYTSNYYLSTLYYRYALLTGLPFSLFLISQSLTLSLSRIKNKITDKNLIINSMKDTYFQKFCDILDSYSILKKSTAIGVMLDLQKCIIEIKSEILLELTNSSINKEAFLEFKINEIQKLDYIKDIDENSINKWLIKYNCSLNDVLNNQISNIDFKNNIDTHYTDLDKFSPEKDLAFLIQTDFYYFFAKYYADQLINFLTSKMPSNTTNIPAPSDTENTNQLSVNQAIILLDKLGVFNTDMFEGKQNTKKAKILSQLLGKNEKNIKTAIEKLELKKSQVSDAYLRDINKIQQILDNLE